MSYICLLVALVILSLSREGHILRLVLVILIDECRVIGCRIIGRLWLGEGRFVAGLQ